jgi:hypothetical protein
MTEINLQSPMSAVLEHFPGAQRVLFRPHAPSVLLVGLPGLEPGTKAL